MEIEYLALVQARTQSTRMPNKVLENIKNESLINVLFQRLNKSKKINKIVLATTENKSDDKLVKEIENIGFDIYRGSERDVLNRYYNAAKKYNAKSIIRITGDCPLVDISIVDKIIKVYEKNKLDYCSNVIPPTYPDGLDAEVFSFDLLKKANDNALTNFEREHVTPYMIKDDSVLKKNVSSKINYSNIRLTVDESDDLDVINNLFDFFHPDIDFSFNDIKILLKKKPEIFQKNNHINRNEGSLMNTGQKLYKRAKKVIPGGTMLLSKRPEMFLPGNWPSYYSKAKGCYIWDLDYNRYLDMSIMGIGTNILGYANDEVDDAVKSTIASSNMSTLNCPEEVDLAEKLIKLHPWAEMVRFARTGGEANAIAIRIARAASGKDNIAICGYHGWHDWYLSTNIGNENSLDNHLIPGLEPKGVPKVLKGTTFTFNYNDIDSLENILNNNDIGVIKMEVSRNNKPNEGFLESVRAISREKNIILIFDECTSGFRRTFGGLHKYYNVNPDIAMFGKAMGNGYAITAVIGSSEIMQEAQNTFISSTFWTERIGPTAALRTLKVMEREESWEMITNTGKIIKKGWKELAKKYELPIKIGGLDSLSNFRIISKNWNKYKTFITQEMLKQNILASNLVYVCIDHTDDIVEEYLHHLDSIFERINTFEHGDDVDNYLDGAEAHVGFRRLN